MPNSALPTADPRGQASGTVARHGRLAQTTVAKSLGKGLAMVLSTTLLSLVVFGGIVWWNLQSGVKTFDLVDNSPEAADIFEGGVNILLVGSDSRADDQGNIQAGAHTGTLNDVNMIFHLSEDHSHATVVSIPRDTLVNVPECANDQGEMQYAQEGVMINSILENGGVNCVVSTVEEMSSIDIQYAAMIGFNGVIAMSNAVGGVEVCVEEGIYDTYSKLELDPGYHTLMGEDALKFLRTRHGVGDGSDLARITNQQVFLSALMRTIKSQETLTNPTKVYGLARAATQNMTLSSNLNSIDTLISIAGAVATVPLSEFTFVRLPVVDSEWWPGRVEPSADADLMWEAILNDVPLSVGTEDEETPAPEESADAEGDDTTVDDGTVDDGTEDAVVEETTPPTLEGQTADVESCSNGSSMF